MLTVRTTGPDFLRLVDTVQQLHGGPEVIVAASEDSPAPTPAPVRARVRLLRSRITALVVLPYVPRWRFDDAASLASAPGSYRRKIEALSLAASQPLKRKGI